MRGSREISLVPSLHGASTDALIWAIFTEVFKQEIRKSVTVKNISHFYGC